MKKGAKIMANAGPPKVAMQLFNRVVKVLVNLGGGPARFYILMVQGRKSGKWYATPVSLVMSASERWLVSPNGEVSWVRNARTAGQVTLSRGGQRETVSIEELGVAERAPILKKYIQQDAFPRRYFEAKPEAPLAAFEVEAGRHPVFRITGVVDAAA